MKEKILDLLNSSSYKPLSVDELYKTLELKSSSEFVQLTKTLCELEDEYLIIRAEDSYVKLDDTLKSDSEVIAGYEKMVAAREAYDALYEAAMAEKDAADVAAFLDFVNSLPEVENLT